MMRRLSAGALISLAMLAGCATAPEVRVTRFHLEQQIARGSVTVEPLLPAEAKSLEFQSYASIVGAELTRIGFAEAPGLAASEQVAVVGVERGSRAALARSSGLTVGLGGGSFGYGGGVGGGISFPIGRSRSADLTLTRLFVQIKRRSDATVVWEGRAETAVAANAPEASPAIAVQRLATALFKDFPGESGRTIQVK